MGTGDVVNIVIGCILLVATFLCYGFQTKTARGISFLSFWFCGITSYFNFLSGVVLDYPKLFLVATEEEILLTIDQWITLALFGSLNICYFIILVQYMYYYLRENVFSLTLKPYDEIEPLPGRILIPNEESILLPSSAKHQIYSSSGFHYEDLVSDSPSSSSSSDDELSSSTTSLTTSSTSPLKPEPKWRVSTTILLFFFYLVLMIVFSGWGLLYLPVFGLDFGDLTAPLFAKGAGYACAVIVFVQWLPQILTTIVNRGAGSFSVVMLVLMMIGAVVNITFLLVAHQNFANISSYVVSFIQQLILFGLLVFFATVERCKKWYNHWVDAGGGRKKEIGDTMKGEEGKEKEIEKSSSVRRKNGRKRVD